MFIKSDMKFLRFSTIVFFAFWLYVFPEDMAAQKQWHEVSLWDSDDYIDYFPEEVIIAENYPPEYLFDGSFNTCWVAGTTKRDTSNVLYVKLPDKIDLNKIILNIFSGYGKSQTLYEQNARPKKIELSIYAAINPEGYASETAVKYFIKEYPFKKKIKLSDTFGVQSFPLNLDKNNLLKFQETIENEYKTSMKENGFYSFKYKTSFILKIEIEDVYKGRQYDDICISEIFFNDRFITPTSLKYREVKDVYIKNDNNLMADYNNEEGVVIFKDTNSVFTMVDWIENGNFAILHYIPNDAAGIASRTEEQYHLVDLKNKKIVDNEFKTYTGLPIMFQLLENDEYGRIYIKNDDLKIELK